jgi:hypothetical protein
VKIAALRCFFFLKGTAFRCFILEPVSDVPLVRLWGSIGTRILIWDGSWLHKPTEAINNKPFKEFSYARGQTNRTIRARFICWFAGFENLTLLHFSLSFISQKSICYLNLNSPSFIMIPSLPDILRRISRSTSFC